MPDIWKKLEENVSADSKTLEMFFSMFPALSDNERGDRRIRQQKGRIKCQGKDR